VKRRLKKKQRQARLIAWLLKKLNSIYAKITGVKIF